MHVAWQGQYKRHVHKRCYAVRAPVSSEGLRFEAPGHKIFSFAEMILPIRCSTAHDQALRFHGKRHTLDRRNGKITKRSGTRTSHF